MSSTPHQFLSLEAFFDAVSRRVSFAVPANATPYDSFSDDLSFDSLEVFELLVVTEILAGVDVPPASTPELASFVDLYDYYVSCVQQTLAADHADSGS